MTLVAVLWAVTSYCQSNRFQITYSVNSDAEWAKSILFPDDSSILINSMFNTTMERGFFMMTLSNSGMVKSIKRQLHLH